MSIAAVAAPKLIITGATELLRDNVSLFVGQPPIDDPRAFKRYVEGMQDQAGRALSALGYYAADVEVTSGTEGDDEVVRVAITANDPVLVDKLDIEVEGPATDDPAFQPILRKLPLTEGAVFISGLYEGAKSALLDQAQDLGYFDFTFTTSEVRVSRRQLTADVKLIADSGQRYTFGDIIFEQDTFSSEFLDRWVPFEEGDAYESSLVGELTENLQNSGYFKSVRVVPQQDRRYGETVPVTVRLERRDNNQIGIGLGFATDTGPRTKLTWSRPLINRHGHSADAELGLSEVRQNLSFAYRIPRDNQPLFNYWGIEYGLQNEINDDTESFLSTLNFQRVSRTRSQWTESLFLRWERERSIIGDERDETDLVLPGVSYSRSRSKGSPFPVWGQATSAQFMAGSKNVLSSIDFSKFVFNFKYLRAFGRRNTLIAGVQFGAINSNDFPRVPASQRFFAGGDRSVRGYKYRDLSPRNIEGEAIGGRYLEVMSLEYNYRFRDRWSAAVFTDAGRAFNNFDSGYAVGAGVGIRWQSPVGPFRVDLAVPVENDDFSGPRIHLSLGPDL